MNQLARVAVMFDINRIKEIRAKQLIFAQARRAGATQVRTDDSDLRKAWLRKHFSSFEYHELLLELHYYWFELIKSALKRAEADPGSSQPEAWLRKKAIPIFEALVKPGGIDKKQFMPGKTFGAAIQILDYGRDTGLENPQTWAWMTGEEYSEMSAVWGYMSQMADNIRRTAMGTWFSKQLGNDDAILDEDNTGPVDWPENWQQEVQADGLVTVRIKANEPVPRAGVWKSVDVSAKQMRADVGDVLPQLNTSYGITLWEWVCD